MNSATDSVERNALACLQRRWADRGVSLVELADGTLLAGGLHLPSRLAAARLLRSEVAYA